MEILQSLLNDRDLRAQVSRLLTNKVRSDAKSLETNALLSKQIVRLATRQRQGHEADGSRLRALVQEHLDFYESLISQGLAFNERLTQRLRQLDWPQEPAPHVQTMRLAACLGQTVRTPFQLENNRGAPISVSFDMSPFVSERGDAHIAAEVAFDPPRVELQPGQVARVEVVVAVTAQGFQAERSYNATLTVEGLDGLQLAVHLDVLAGAPINGHSSCRVEPEVQDPAPQQAPAQATAPASAVADAATHHKTARDAHAGARRSQAKVLAQATPSGATASSLGSKPAPTGAVPSTRAAQEGKTVKVAKVTKAAKVAKVAKVAKTAKAADASQTAATDRPPAAGRRRRT